MLTGDNDDAILLSNKNYWKCRENEKLSKFAFKSRNTAKLISVVEFETELKVLYAEFLM